MDCAYFDMISTGRAFCLGKRSLYESKVEHLVSLNQQILTTQGCPPLTSVLIAQLKRWDANWDGLAFWCEDDTE